MNPSRLRFRPVAATWHQFVSALFAVRALAAHAVRRQYVGACLALAFGGLAPFAHATNAIVAENQLPGTDDSIWQIQGLGDPSIQGFATDISVNKGGTIQFKISTDASLYHLDIYRIGYYGGNGARLVATVNPSATLPQVQPDPITDANTGLIDCGNWGVSASWTVPSDAVSGVYIAKVIRTDFDTGNGNASHIPFIVRDDASTSDVIFQTSDTTWEAYNQYGGNSLYAGDPVGRAYKVSYNRPFITRDGNTNHDWLFNAEYPMIRWLESNGYDVTYTTGVDSDRRGNLLANHKLFLSVGHDEYWSGAQRTNVETARDAGLNLAFFSGNEVFWKTRWENSTDGSNTPYRTLVCYKETHAGMPIDPLDDGSPSSIWTGTWRDPRFSPPADGGRPENALTGTVFKVNGPAADSITVPPAYFAHRFWRNTGVDTLAGGATAVLPAGTLGYEWDEAPVNAFQPPGLMRLSLVSLPGEVSLQDYGSTYAPATATHSLTLYRRPGNRALVFGAGTVQWSWGLDPVHDADSGTPLPPSSAMQQATVNLFADMGVQPGSIQSGLVPTTASADATPPTSVIVSPTDGSSVNAGTPVTVTGTASDLGGGIVWSIEVSTDGGTTWQPATGSTSWSYTFTPWQLGPLTIKTRAVDDNGNLETPSAGISLTITGSATSAQYSLWQTSDVPTIDDAGADLPLEVGVKFRSDVTGTVTGLRFYKSLANGGTHVGHLWSSDGTLLAAATFTGETDSGWQEVDLIPAVPIAANTEYVASYHADAGDYADDNNYFSINGVDNGPLHAPADSNGDPNGVYAYGPTGTFPNGSYLGSNYWIDVIFQTYATPVSVAVSPANATIVAGGTQQFHATATYADNSTLDVTNQVTWTSSNTTAATIVAGGLATGVYGGNATITANLNGVTGSQTLSVLVGALVINTTTLPAGVVTTPYSATLSISGGFPPYSWTVDAGTFPAGLSLNPSTGAITGTPTATGTFNFTLRVTDSGTLQSLPKTATQAFSVTITLPPPKTLWPSSAVPGNVDAGPNAPIELGVKFKSDAAGTITGVRFYKSVANTGTHVGHLWGIDGSLLATATFTGETASGWQQVDFSSPVAIAANTLYVASYHTTVGDFSADVDYFTNNSLDNAPLHAPASGLVGGQGVFTVGASGVFPTSTFSGSNYWVDVVFQGVPPPVSIAVTPTNPSVAIGATQQFTATATYPDTSTQDITTGVTWASSATGRATISLTGLATGVSAGPTTISATLGSVSGSTTLTVLPAPLVISTASLAGGTLNTPYSATLAASGGTMPYTWSLASGALPDGLALDGAGGITGTPTVKGTFNFTVQVSDAGVQVQTKALSIVVTSTLTSIAVTPVNPTIDVGTTQQFTATGTYADTTTQDITSQVTWVSSATTHATIASGGLATSVAVGTTTISATLGSISDSTTLTVQPAPLVITTSSLAAGTWNSAYSASLAATGGTTPYIWSVTTGSLPAGLSLNSTTGAITGTPTAAGTANFTVEADDAGNPTKTATQALSIAIGFPSAVMLWPANPVPTELDAGPDSAVEVGVKFKSDVAGRITGIRFYKAVANTGTHIGSLWSSTGTLLATATFTGETASGWQQVAFSPAVTITANTTYVAAYHTDVAHFSRDTGYFTTNGVDNAPLHAPANPAAGGQGVFKYSATSIFPDQSGNGSNYWVDVVFQSLPPPDSLAVTPATPSIAIGATQQFTATGTYFDASTQDLTALVTWASADTSRATINASGLATGVAGGASTISASLGSVSGNTTLAVQPAPLSVTTTFLPAAVISTTYASTVAATGGTMPYTWSISGGALPDGLTIDPASGAITGQPTTTGTFAFTVQAADLSNPVKTATQGLSIIVTTTLVSIAVTPANPTIDVGTPQQFTATGSYADSSTLDLTNQVNWSSSSTAQATIDASGLASGVAVGTSTITATSGIVSGNTTLTVQPAPLVITTSSLADGALDAAYSASVSAVGGTTPYAWSITAGTLPEGLTLNPGTGAITGTPSATGAFNFTVQATDAGNPVKTATRPLSIAVSLPAAFTLWPANTVPGNIDAGPDVAYELGVKFQSDVPGKILGIRFYKAGSNTGTHIGNLWDNTGHLLATATFSGETASGWQQVNFSTAVNIEADTIYVASYHLEAGHFSRDPGYFASNGVDNAPLHAPADGVAGGQGVFVQSDTSAYPTSSVGSSNYWVDVAFQPTLAATVTLGSLHAVYDGSPKPATATTNPGGLTVAFTYDGSATAPTDAGSYAVTGTIIDTYFAGTASGTLVIDKADQPAPVISSDSSLNFGDSYSATANTGFGVVSWALGTGSTATGAAIDPNSGAITYMSTGTVVINATFAGDGDHHAATSADFPVSINPAPTTFALSATSFTYTGLAQGPTINPTPSGATFDSGGALTATNAGSYAATATATGNYTGSNNALNWTITKAPASVTLGSLAATYDGSAHSATATTTPSGLTVTFTYDGSPTAPTAAGSYTVVGTINDINYAGTATGTLVIAKATPTVTWSTPAAITYGTALDSSELNATASVPGTFVYNPVTGTVLNAGSQTLGVTFTPSDSGNYTGATGSVTLTVNPAPTTFALSATSFVYTGSPQGPTINPTPSGATFTPGGTTSSTDVGNYTATATATGNYTGSNNALNWSITKASQAAPAISSGHSVVFGNPYTAAVSNLGSGFGALSWALGSGSTADTPGIDPISGVVTYSSTGTVIIIATFAGDANHSSASSAPYTITVGDADQPAPVISSDATTTFGDVYTASVSNAGTAIGALSWALGDNSTAADAAIDPVSGKIAYTSTGTVIIKATFAGDVDHNPATSAEFTVTVNPATATVALGGLGATYDGAAHAATATTTPSGLTVDFTYDGSPTAPTAAGSYAVLATVNDINYVGTATGTLVIAKTTPVITWNTPAAITYGTALDATQLNATADVDGSFAYNPVSGTVLAAGSQSLGVTFTPTDTANYTGATGSVTLTVNAATTTFALSATSFTYTGSAQGPTINPTPSGSTFTPGGTTSAIVVGNYTATATATGNYTGSNNALTWSITKAPATVTLGSLAATYDGLPHAATASTTPSGLTVDLTYDGSPTAPTAAGSYTVVGTINDANYSGTSTGTLVIAKAAPTVTWNTPAAITYGTALDVTQLNATASVPGTFAYNPVSGTVLDAGSQSLGVTFTPIDTANYTGATGSVTLTVNAATTTFALSATSFVYTGSAQSPTINPTPSGSTFTPGGTTSATVVGNYTATATATGNYTGSNNALTWSITKAPATVTLGSLAATYDGLPHAATATTTPSGLTVDLTYNGNPTAPTAAGSYTVVGTINDANYSGTATGTLVIAKATPVITWNTPAAITYGTALDGTQLDATASVPGTLAYSPVSGTVLAAGAQSLGVTFTPTDSTDYTGATGSVTLTVNAATTTFALSATSFTYTGSPQGPTVNPTPSGATFATGGTLTATNAGNFTATATANGNYTGSNNALNWSIAKATATVTLGSLAATYDGSAHAATATTAPSGLTVDLTYNGNATAPTAAGSYTVVGTINDTNYSGTATGTLVIAKATPTVTWNTPAAITYGTALDVTQLNATASVPGSFVYSPATGAVLNAGSQSLGVTFTPTDTTDYTGATGSVTLTVNAATTTFALSSTSFTYTGSPQGPTVNPTPSAATFATGGTLTATNAGNFTATATATGNYTGSNNALNWSITKATATVTLGSLAATYDGSAHAATATTAPSGLTVDLTYNGNPTAPTAAGSYTVVGTINDANYSGTATGTLVISKATPVITWSTPAAITYGTALSATQLNATASVPGSFVYSPATGAVLNAGSQSLGVTFTPTDAANYNGATGSVTLTVNAATTTFALSATSFVYTGSPQGPTINPTPSAATFATGGTLTATNAGNYTATATATGNYTGSNNALNWSIAKAPATVTLGSLAATYDGSAHAATATTTPSGLTVDVTYNGSATAPTAAGSYTVVGTINDTNYSGTATGTLVIAKATPTVTWNTPAAITYGTALDVTQLNATASVPGSFVYSPATGAVLNAGSQTLGVTFTPTDSTDYTGATGSVTLTVNAATTTFALSATSFVYTGSAQSPTINPTPSGSTFTPGGTTSATVVGNYTATATATGNYTGSNNALNWSITKATQSAPAISTGHTTIFGDPYTATVSNSGSAFGALSWALGSGSTATGAAIDPVTGVIAYSSTGTVVITATFAGDANHSAATSANFVITVNATGQPAPVISSADTTTFGDTYTATVSNAGTAFGALSWALGANSTAADAAIDPVTGVISYTSTGTVVINATFAGDVDHGAATSGDFTITVNPAPTTFALDATSFTYDGSVHTTNIVATPAGATFDSGGTTSATVVGNYTATATATGNYTGSNNALTWSISPATAAVTLGSLAATYDGSAHAATATTTPSGLTVDLTYNGSATAPTAAGSYTVVGTINDANYTGTATGTLVIAKATPTVTWNTPAAITYGTALDVTQLNATASVPGTFVYSPVVGTVLAAGSQTLGVTFTPTDAANYNGNTGSVSLTVNAATTTFALSATSFTYTGSPQGPTINPTPAGATFTPGGITSSTNAGNYTATATATGNYTGSNNALTWSITKAPATVTLGSLAATYDGSAHAATATTTPSGLAVDVTYNGSATAPTAAGSYTVVGTINDTNYTGTATGTLVIAKATPTVTWSTPAAITYGTALDVTQLNATSSVPGSFVYSPVSGTVLNAGSQSLGVTFTPTDTTDYTGATGSVTLTVNAATTTFALSSTSFTYTGSPQGPTVNPTPSAATFATGGTLTATNAGNYTATATATGNYTGSNNALNWSITKATATVTLGSLAATYDASAHAATATTAPSGLTVDLTYNGNPTAPTAAGSYTVVGTINDANYSGTATGTLVIAKATPTVTWNTPAAITYGTALSGTQLNATASVPGSFVYSPATGAVLNAGSQSLGVTFTPTDTTDYTGATGSVTLTVNAATTTFALSSTSFTYTGSPQGPTINPTPSAATFATGGTLTATNAGNYTATATANGNYTGSNNALNWSITKATATVTLGSLAATYDASAHAATATTTPSGLTVDLTYNGSATAPTAAGSYTVVGTINDTNYSGTATGTLVIAKATPTVTWSTPAAITYGTALGAGQLNATASVPGSFVYSPATGAVLNAGSQSLGVTFTPTDTANYTGATGSVTLTVNAATTTFALSATTFTYSGSARTTTIVPTPAGATFTPGGTLSATNAGSYTATATATGNYSGSNNALNWSITKASQVAPAISSAHSIMFGDSYTAAVSNLGTAFGALSWALGSGSTATGAAIDPVTGVVLYSSTGTVVINATYAGDANHNAATSSNFTITVSASTQPAPVISSADTTTFGDTYTATVSNTGFGPLSWALGSDSTAADAAIDPVTGVISYTSTGTVVINATFASDADHAAATSADFTVTVNPATATVTLGSLAATYDGATHAATATTAPSGLTVDLTYDGSPTAPSAVGSYAVVATVNDINYTGTASGTLVIANAAATVTLGNLAATYDGSAHAATASTTPSGLTVDLTYNGSATAPTAAGSYTVVGTINDANYTGTASGTLVISKATPTVTWNTPAAITYGTALDVTQLNATASVPGTFVYSPVVGTVLAAGAQSLGVTFTPTDTANYTGATGSVTLTVNAATTTFALSATSFVYTGSAQGPTINPTPSGATFTPGGTTSATVVGNYTATATATGNYTGSNNALTWSITKAPATVTLGSLAATYDGSAHAATATTTPSGLAVDVTYNGSATAPTAAGSYTVVGTINDTNYSGTATGTLVIAKATPTVTWNTPAAITYGTALDVTQLNATASVLGSFVYSPATGAVLNAGSQSLGVTFTPTDTTDYTGATGSVTLTVNAATTTFALSSTSFTYTGSPQGPTVNPTPSAATFATGGTLTATNAGNFTATATATGNYTGSNNALNWSIAKATATVTLGSLAATYDGSAHAATATTAPSGLTVDLTYNGNPTAPTAAGSYTVVGTINDANYSGTATGTLVISKATPVITWSTPAAITYGTALSATQLNATASVPGSFVYSPATGAVLNAGSQSLGVTFTPTDAANYNGATGSVTLTVNAATTTFALSATSFVYTGSPQGPTINPTPSAATFATGGTLTATNAGNYTATATATGNYTGSNNALNWSIAKAPATVTLGSLAATYNGSAHAATATTAPSGLTVDLTYNGNATAPTAAGSYTVVGTINDTNYSGTATGTLVIAKATPTVTWNTPAAITYGTALGGGQLNATASVPGAFVYSPAAGAVLNAGAQSLGVTFTPTDSTDYTGATGTVNLTVNAAPTTFALSATSFVYTGSAQGPTINPTPAGATFNFGGTISATVVGNYAAAATATGNYTGTNNALNWSITKASQTAPAINSSHSTVFGSTYTASVSNLGSAFGALSWALGSGSTATGAAIDPSTGLIAYTSTGTVVITATFAGDANHNAATSSNFIVTVSASTQPAPIISSADTTTFGDTYTATVSNAGTAFGALSWALGANSTAADAAIDPVTGVISYTSTGTVVVNATFAGDVDHGSATSADFTITINPATATVTLGSLAATYDGSIHAATASTTPSGLTVDLTYDGSPTAPTAAGSYAVVATVNDTNYTGTATGTLVIAKATPILTWNTPAAITYGTALDVTQLNATASVPGTFAYSPVAGTVLAAGAQSLGVTFTPTDSTDYTGATGSVTLTVNAATTTFALSSTSFTYTGSPQGPTINPTPSGATFTPGGSTSATVVGNYTATAIATGNYTGSNNALTWSITKATAAVTLGSLAATYDTSAHAATATTTPSGLTVDLTYDGSPTAPTAAGSYAVIATVNDANYTGTASGTLVISKATSVITWNTPAAITYGTALDVTQLNATASVPGSFVYSPVAGAVLNAGSQSLGVTFTPTDTANYTGATGSVTLTVNAATTTFALSSTSFTYTGSPQGPTINPTPSGATFATGGTLTATNAGNYTATATANGNYTGSNNALNWSIGKAAQATLTVSSSASGTFGTAYTAATSGGSGTGAITWSLGLGSTAPGAAINATTGAVTSTGAGTVVINATKAADANYLAAISPDFTVSLAKAAATVTLGSLAATYDGTAKAATATTTPAGLTVNLTYNGSATTPTNAGSYAVVGTVSDANYSGSASGTLVIAKATPTITWAAPFAITQGTPLGGAQLNASASTAGSFVYSPAAGAVLSAGVHTLNATFTPTDATDFNGATAQQSLTVTASNPSRSGADFNGDGSADLLWQNTLTGERVVWLMNGTTFVSGISLTTISPEWSIAAVADFNGDGQADLVWQNTLTGERALWLMNGTTFVSGVSLGTVSTDWSIMAAADFNGDGKPDIVWQNNRTGDRAVWLMNGTAFASNVSLGSVPTDWSIAGTGDFNGDGQVDLVWQNRATGNVGLWTMNGTTQVGSTSLGTAAANTQISGTADLNADGKPDILWTNTVTGARSVWLMNGITVGSTAAIATVPTDWILNRPLFGTATADFDGDGNSDLVWQNTVTGERALWLMNGTTFESGVSLGTLSTAWSIAGTGDFNRDGKADILWQNTSTGERYLWIMDRTGFASAVSLGIVPTQMQIVGVGDFNGDGKPDILWQNTSTGERSVWLMDGTTFVSSVSIGFTSTDWSIAGAADFNGDGHADILWQNTVTGERAIWLMNGTTFISGVALGTISTDWSIAGTGDFNADGQPDILWQNTVTGQRAVWLMDGSTFATGVSLGTIPTQWSIGN